MKPAHRDEQPLRPSGWPLEGENGARQDHAPLVSDTTASPFPHRCSEGKPDDRLKKLNTLILSDPSMMQVRENLTALMMVRRRRKGRNREMNP